MSIGIKKWSDGKGIQVCLNLTKRQSVPSSLTVQMESDMVVITGTDALKQPSDLAISACESELK